MRGTDEDGGAKHGCDDPVRLDVAPIRLAPLELTMISILTDHRQAARRTADQYRS